MSDLRTYIYYREILFTLVSQRAYPNFPGDLFGKLSGTIFVETRNIASRRYFWSEWRWSCFCNIERNSWFISTFLKLSIWRTVTLSRCIPMSPLCKFGPFISPSSYLNRDRSDNSLICNIQTCNVFKCHHYSKLSLISHSSKTLLRIILNRMNP